ncbi:MAG: Biotin synthase [Promethearchaeota archaeon]|nr:MAG: Biotin synthase [Candidatus Lokiarchaeota archaeon]
MSIEKIRVSYGSAVKLGLIESVKTSDVVPTTCYLMTYKKGKCTANCGFCPQARSSESSMDRLSRIVWPTYDLREVLTKLKYLRPANRFERICIQTLNYPDNFKDLTKLIPNIKENTSTPISIAIPPMSKDEMLELKYLGAERVGIALDAATPELFETIKGKEAQGPYNWYTHYEALTKAVEVFSERFVSTHLIVGLGETPKQLIQLIESLNDLHIIPSLFAFMPIKGTQLENAERPYIVDYRKMQLARYLLIHGGKSLKDLTFNQKGEIINFNINKQELSNIIEENIAFMTTGCPDCNRPYYTSRPSGPIYNYPRKLNEAEKKDIFDQLKKFVKF